MPAAARVSLRAIARTAGAAWSGAVALLRGLAGSGPLRSGELATRLAVEASHVTRQVQHLEKRGYVTMSTDAGAVTGPRAADGSLPSAPNFLVPRVGTAIGARF